MRIHKPSIFKQASFSFLSFLLVLSMVSSAMPFFVSEVVSAATKTVCASSCDYTTIEDAVATEPAASTVTVKAGTYTPSNVVINKAFTLQGETGATITTSGSAHVFVTTAADVVIEGFNFEKTDKINQNLINVQGANNTIKDNNFTGQYTLALNDHTSRALEISTTAGLTITGNNFNNLRQPAYINDNTTGVISNNYVNQTRGWVVLANTDLTFSGNTWGTNAVDIAIIPGLPNNYDCARTASIKASNNHATVDNQAVTRHCVTPPTPQNGVTVRPSDLQGWSGVDDNGNGGSLSFVSGPGTPPISSGSAQLQVGASNQGYLLARADYGGTKLSDIDTISYSTYVQDGNNTIAPSMQINVVSDVDVAPTWQGRLVYEPYMNGAVVDGQWQTWQADEGKWWLSKPASFGGNCGQSSPCTFEQLITLYPKIGLNSGDQLVGFKAGSAWSNFTGNVDAYTFASAGRNDIYNFEPDTVEDCNASTFDNFTLGSVDGQGSWKSTGNYDQEVVNNTYGYASLGCKSLRISNATTSGSFGDQTFSNPTTPAGETVSGAAKNHYEASFSIASTKPTQQTGLSLSVSPDDGTGNRMSYLRFEDQSDGIHVFFDEVTGTSDSTIHFVESDIATLTRNQIYDVKIVIDYKDGASNDIVKVYIDGNEKVNGTSWENYYRYAVEQAGNGNKVPVTDRLLFRAAGSAVPANQGNGYLFDNVVLITTTSSQNGDSGSNGDGTTTQGPSLNGSVSPLASANSTNFASSALSILGVTTGDSDDNGETLSTKTGDSTRSGDVKAATDERSDKGCWKIFGICWYWWIPILIVIAAIVAYIVRRRQNEAN